MLRFIRVLSAVSVLVLIYLLNPVVAWAVLLGTFAYFVGRRRRLSRSGVPLT